MDTVSIKLKVNPKQLGEYLGNTPNVTAAQSIRELLEGALTEYLDEYNINVPTGIDFEILEVKDVYYED